jgi:hypothetical protein
VSTHDDSTLDILDLVDRLLCLAGFHVWFRVLDRPGMSKDLCLLCHRRRLVWKGLDRMRQT